MVMTIGDFMENVNIEMWDKLSKSRNDRIIGF